MSKTTKIDSKLPAKIEAKVAPYHVYRASGPGTKGASSTSRRTLNVTAIPAGRIVALASTAKAVRAERGDKDAAALFSDVRLAAGGNGVAVLLLSKDEGGNYRVASPDDIPVPSDNLRRRGAEGNDAAPKELRRADYDYPRKGDFFAYPDGSTTPPKS